jgi:flagellar hook protein FlgE
MSLYGALFSGVSGLKSQANKLGVISDNVANVNTVGYKGGNGLFETLVTSATTTSAYSPGGVLGGNRLLVSKQGLLQATDSPTDIAISGNGFYVVNQSADGAGQVFYTRSGSFRADSTGNFRNASGFYLQAWPLDREGRLPGAAGNTTYTTSSANLNSLRVVNVQNLTGSAAATSAVQLGANLNASQSVFAGAAGSITMDSLSTSNRNIAAKDIIVPSSVNHVARGDKINITTGDGLSFSYRYGGFTFGRSVNDALGSDSGEALLTNSTGLGTNPFALTDGSNVVTVTHTAHGLEDGAVITLSGNSNDIAGIPSSEFNGRFVVNVIDEDTYTFEVSTSASVDADAVDNSVVTTNGANASVTVDVGNSNYSVGQSITIAGSQVVNGITINGTHTITAVSGTTVTWATNTTTPPTIPAQAFSTAVGTSNVTVTIPSGQNTYVAGQTIVIAGALAMNGVTINGTRTITAVSGNDITFAGTGTAATVTLANDPITFSAATLDPTVIIDLGVGGAANYSVGDTITIAGAGTVNGVPINGSHVITAIVGDTVRYVATGETASATTAGGGASVTAYQSTGGGASATNFKPAGGGTAITTSFDAGGGAAITSVTRPFGGSILDAINTETRFLATTGTTGFTANALKFNITTAATGTVTFTYTSASPDVRQKQFNNLSNLAASINEVTGLSARVVSNQLYVGATDANAAVTFSNGSTVGTEGPPVQAGIDWVRELGLKNIPIGTNRFSTLQGLYNLATTDAGISARLENPLGDTTLRINVDDPLDTINFADSPTVTALATITSNTPITTVSGSTAIVVTHAANPGVTNGDFVTLDGSAMANTTTIPVSAPFSTAAAGADPTITVDITGLGQTFVAGQLVTFAGATAVNGVDVNGTWTVVTASSTSLTFVATGETSTGAGAGGGAAGTSSYGSFNGIPLSDLSGRFEVSNVSANSYTINVNTKATSSGSTGYAGLIVTPHNNLGSLVAELGLVTSLNGAAYTPQSTSDFGPAYSPTDTTLNMASGSIASQFSRPIRIYDAQGGGHDLNVSFLKTAVNTWAIEVYAIPADDISSSLPDGLIAYGNVVFNGDGTLRQVDSTLSDAATITWTNGAASSAVSFGWGTTGEPGVGAADGLSQYNAAYKVSFANQNGAPVGELTGVSITELGIVVASYSNGQTQSLYKIPVADFANPDQLQSSTGNVFSQSADSGEFNLRQAGTSGVGKIAASSLEASNVELSAELTDMIIAQRSYQANAKVISTSDNMLEQLNQIIR